MQAVLPPRQLPDGRRAARDFAGAVPAGEFETATTSKPPEEKEGSGATEATEEAERTNWRGFAPRAEDWAPELAEPIQKPRTES